jgi:hypothetical protein
MACRLQGHNFIPESKKNRKRKTTNDVLMRRIFFTATLLLFSAIVCLAQPAELGFFAGPQMSTARYAVGGDKQSVSSKYGFQAGSTVKIPFDNKLYFAPALFYSLKGYKVKLDKPSILPDSLAIDNNTTIHTFEIAALLQYDFTTKANHMYMKLGPSIDVQLFGNEKFNRKNNKVVDREMTFSFTKYGRFGANMLVLLGYEMSNGIFVAAQYNHGMGSVSNADFGPRIHHRVFGVSIGKYFIRKK